MRTRKSLKVTVRTRRYKGNVSSRAQRSGGSCPGGGTCGMQ